MKHGDLILMDMAAIESHILSFYQNLFAVDNECQDIDLVESVIPPWCQPMRMPC